MNDKQVKRIRRNIRTALGERFTSAHDTTYIRGLVDSRQFNTTVNGELQEGKAIKVIVEPTSFRGIYLKVKARVQANRGKGRKRVLHSIQLRPEEIAGALEHSGAEGVQPKHREVSVL